MFGPTLALAGLLLSGRAYHPVPVAQLGQSAWTHVVVTGQVTRVRRQADGDWHVRVTDGGASVICEIIPRIPLAPPRLGQKVRVYGISRFDRQHQWEEVHPVEYWEVSR